MNHHINVNIVIKHLNKDTGIIYNNKHTHICILKHINRWKDHLRLIHTGEKPFDCPHCHKSYRKKSAFNSHLKKTHGIKQS